MNFKDKIPAEVNILAHHIPVRIAGGAVRDLIMGLEPKDYDLATTWLPQDVVGAATEAGFQVIPTGLKHGTVTVVVDGMPLEVTTLRIDRETDGRHAEVEYTKSWKEDAARRDFTINSLFLSIDGEVIDFFHGVDDIRSRSVRFVGDPDKRIQEDYLRLLRLYRMCAKMGKDSCPEYHVQAVRRNAHGLKKISGERIWSELAKIIDSDMAPTLLRAMKDADVLQNIEMPPRLNPETLESVTRLTESPVTRLMAAMWDSGSTGKLLKAMKDRWKVSGAELRLARSLKENRADSMHTKGPDLYQMLVFLDGVSLEHARELAALHQDVGAIQFLNNWEVPVFPINGDDLKELGMTPGPYMGEALGDLRFAWFSGNFKMNRDELLDLAKEKVADYQ